MVDHSKGFGAHGCVEAGPFLRGMRPIGDAAFTVAIRGKADILSCTADVCS